MDSSKKILGDYTILQRMREMNKTPSQWNSTTKYAEKQLCPVCKGKQTVPKGFYANDLYTEDPECRTCKGKGII